MLQDPSTDGRFGEFGGRFVPETLIQALDQLEAESIHIFREVAAESRRRAAVWEQLRDRTKPPHIGVLLEAFTGEPFTYEGREVVVTPTPPFGRRAVPTTPPGAR